MARNLQAQQAQQVQQACKDKTLEAGSLAWVRWSGQSHLPRRVPL